ncbi:MAG: Ku protein [Dehalococcoidia bacterium]
MARRSIWKGAISFGMVAIPVKLYTATENKDFSFTNLHKGCGLRLRMKRYCPEHGDVGSDEMVRAYEYAPDQYVVMEESDFENLPVASLHTVEINEFVDLREVDPINFERTYMLEPEGVGVKPFYLLKQALENSERAAVARISLRNKEHICCVRPYGHSLALHTMYQADEIRGTEGLNLPEEQTAINEQEMGLATSLIDSLQGSYDPSRYRDEYRYELERIIENKLGAGELVSAPPSPPKAQVGDLMEALRASLASVSGEGEAAREQGGEAEPEVGKGAKKRRMATKAKEQKKAA